MRTGVTKANARIKALAPVPTAPFADGLVSTTAPVDVMANCSGGKFYLFAGAKTVAGASNARFSIPCTGDVTVTVTVLDENRSISPTGAAFTDSFADGNAVHTYRIEGGGSCRLSC